MQVCNPTEICQAHSQYPLHSKVPLEKPLIQRDYTRQFNLIAVLGGFKKCCGEDAHAYIASFCIILRTIDSGQFIADRYQLLNTVLIWLRFGGDFRNAVVRMRALISPRFAFISSARFLSAEHRLATEVILKKKEGPIFPV